MNIGRGGVRCNLVDDQPGLASRRRTLGRAYGGEAATWRFGSHGGLPRLPRRRTGSGRLVEVHPGGQLGADSAAESVKRRQSIGQGTGAMAAIAAHDLGVPLPHTE
jgi:hypothetical protein